MSSDCSIPALAVSNETHQSRPAPNRTAFHSQRFCSGLQRIPIRLRGIIIFLNESYAQDQNVAPPELYPLRLCARLKFLYANWMRGPRT
jgi:hypothetical protein